jgi:putative transposase
MCHTKNCYQVCINKKFLIDPKLLKNIEKIIAKIEIKSRKGRPLLDIKRVINGIYYILVTGIHWNALPRCFGSYSAIHRLFQKLRSAEFFKHFWHAELHEYDQKNGLDLKNQAADCISIKAPLGQEKTGKSPVDRRKLGTKRSILTDRNGIMIGCALGSANQHDSKLFLDTLLSIPKHITMPYYKIISLDSAYDSAQIRAYLLHYGYIPKIAKNNRKSKNKISDLPVGYERWFVEPAHSWLNRFRRLFIRYDKYASNYIAMIQFAAAIIIFNKT